MATKEKPSDIGSEVRLEAIEVRGYRSCRGTTFTPNVGLSALIGINGAGKTNVLQGIRLLARRGRPTGRPSDEELGATAEVVGSFRVRGETIGLKLTLSLHEGARAGGGADFVPITEAWNLGSLTGSKRWIQMPPIRLLRGGSAKFVDLGDRRVYYESTSGISYATTSADVDVSVLQNKAVLAALLAIEDFRSGISYYSASQFTDPSRCPSGFEVDEQGRLVDSYNPYNNTPHLRFLHDLYTLRKGDAAAYEAYQRFVSRAELGLISRFTWKVVELSTSTAVVSGSGKEVKKIKKKKSLIVPKVQIGTSHLTFNQLSEGTFKTLALAFYITTSASKFLMVEEPEVCVHHGLLTRIVATIKAHARRKQIVISTHSDLLVDELEPEQLFVVEMLSTGTAVKKLESWLDKRDRSALHAYLAESGTLGEYWRSGGLAS